MTIVHSQIVKPDGTGTSGWVTIRQLGLGLQRNSDLSVLGVTTIRVEGGGRWSADLVPNEPQSPYYSVTQSPDNGVPREVLISVPDSDRSQNLSDLLVTVPLPSWMDAHVFQGPAGTPGAPGEKGEKGDPGPPGNVSGAEFATAVADQLDPGDEARTKLDAAFEALVPRTGATAGQLATLQADGTIAFANAPAGDGTAVPDATTTVKGVVELATTTEATTGSDTVRAVTPAGVKAVADTVRGEFAAADASKVTGSGITAIRALTQAQYDSLSPKSSTTLYVIV